VNVTTSGSKSSDEPNHTDLSGSSSSSTPGQRIGCSARWTQFVKTTHEPTVKTLQVISQYSARNPKRTIAAVVVLSILLLVVGLVTNFNLEVDEKKMWTPENSYPIRHSNWISNDSGFPKEPRLLVLFFHADGANVLGKDQVSRVFEAVDTVRNMEGYDEVCKDSNYESDYGVATCEITGVLRFWNISSSLYNDTVSSDMDAIVDMSQMTYPDGTPVAEDRVFGFPLRDPDTGLLVSVQSYSVWIVLPATERAQEWELNAIDELLTLEQLWVASGDGSLRVEVKADGSAGKEFAKAIEGDVPLVPIVFVVMSVFTCLVFFRRNRVYSRSLLGFGAVAAVLLSIMTSCGILFIAGVPFTSMTQLLPFIFFGIGLDDAFIMMGSYVHTDHSKDAVDNIADTIDDIGLSIFLTTVTSATAFGLGCMSSVPAVYWVCLYTFPTIIIVLLYQLTFFVACIILDEHRIRSRRMDCCLWVKAKDFQAAEQYSNDMEDEGPQEHTIMDRFMARYAEKLLMPWVKVLVVIAFTFLVGFAGYSVSLMTQQFRFTDTLPSDSYLTTYIEATEQYTARTSVYAGVYFRYVDQSDHLIQAQMLKYVNDLVAMDAEQVQPDYFWLPDFQSFANESGISNLTFRDQIYLFRESPVFRNLFFNDIVLDSVGNIIASRTFVNLARVDLEDVRQQIDAVKEQQAVTRAQPVNQGRDEFAFFSYAYPYNMWEFFRVTPRELMLTTVVGVAAVTGITALLIPHWSAVIFVFPMICVLYVDLLGVLQWAGLHINAISYFTLALSIGLLVDYIMHILLRYYEMAGNRREKTISTLRTIGASVLLGGISTFLGTLPLVFRYV